MKSNTRRIQKLSTSFYVNIPMGIMKSLGLQVEDELKFEEADGKIIGTVGRRFTDN
jgi:antitoxin component of MazEF toxin-antitoxin module